MWVACSYDGAVLVNKGVFADWLDVPNYGEVAITKSKIVEDPSPVKLTQAHIQIRSLLRSFSKDIRMCFVKQVERRHVERPANGIISSWQEGDSTITKEDVFNAEKEHAELNASLKWPQCVGHMDTLFAKAKVYFKQHLYGTKVEPSSANAELATQPGSDPQTTSSAKLDHSPPDEVVASPRIVPADFPSVQTSCSSNVATLPPVPSATHERTTNPNPEPELGPQDSAAKQGNPPLGRLEQTAVSAAMSNDVAVAHACDASRTFWENALEEPASEWHSMALFLKNNHSALFSSPPPHTLNPLTPSPPPPSPPPTPPLPSA